MGKMRILSFLAAFICLFYLSIPTFALTGNPYQDSQGQGYSEYQAESRPQSGGNTGANMGTPSNGGLYNGAGGNNGYGMPGSGTQSGGYNGMPGSGTQSGGYGGMPGSGSGYYTGGSSGVPTTGNLTGSPSGSGGSNGEHFNASLGTDGSITLSLPGAEGVTAGDSSSAISLIFTKYRAIALVISGVCTITAILSLLVQITKLGAAGDNERMRVIALKGIIFSGSALAIFGSLAVVVGFFWNAFV